MGRTNILKNKTVLSLSNDGVDSEFHHLLVDLLRTEYSANVTQISIQRNKSGSGSGVTLRQPFNVTCIETDSGHTHIVVDGTVTDALLAVKFFRTALLGENTNVDFIFIGPNKGVNVGIRRLYSSSVFSCVVSTLLFPEARVVGLGVDCYEYEDLNVDAFRNNLELLLALVEEHSSNSILDFQLPNEHLKCVHWIETSHFLEGFFGTLSDITEVIPYIMREVSIGPNQCSLSLVFDDDLCGWSYIGLEREYKLIRSGCVVASVVARSLPSLKC